MLFFNKTNTVQHLFFFIIVFFFNFLFILKTPEQLITRIWKRNHQKRA